MFTTRPDTLFGATYMVLAPEHQLVDAVSSPDKKQAVHEYRRQAATKSELDRGLDKDKSGVFSGGYCQNPATGKPVPIWIADYVLMGYGTGAIMAVPGHDERDFEFAKRFELPIVTVVQGGTQEQAFTEDGVAVNSANSEVALDGVSTSEAKKRITAWLEAKGLGKGTVQFKLRDWLFDFGGTVDENDLLGEFFAASLGAGLRLGGWPIAPAWAKAAAPAAASFRAMKFRGIGLFDVVY